MKTFQTRNAVIDIGTNLKKWYKENVFDKLQAKLENFSEKQSGWALSEVLFVKININNYAPIKDSQVIPVVFHNLSGYDVHFIIRELATGVIPGEIKLLPVNKEKYISFTKFMSSSIDKLSSYLENDKKTLIRLHSDNANEFGLLTRKGIFPYDYVDSWERLNELELPPRDAFFSNLKNEAVSEADYEHALNVWNTFNIKTLGDYSDLYLKTDVLLLADIFENFRNTCIETYRLDPLHYYTAPGLAFDAMLKVTGVKLELLTDIDQLMFIEKGIRGGITQCSTRYAKANNPFMKDYNSDLDTTYLLYLDINNLYGATMCNFLPFGEFSFVEDIENLDILNHPDDADVGYIVDCDLDYPSELHESDSDFPMAPEHMIPLNSKFKKLMLTLYPKREYVVHYRNLKIYVQHGLKLVKINRVLQFKQSPWLKKYIELNIGMRQRAKNEFDKNFYKLMINSPFGKLMENVRKYKEVHLLTKWGGRYGARAYISKPNFHSCTIFDKDMVIIEMNRLEVFFNKPIYAGFAVLDISKTFLYDFHYNYVLKKFQKSSAKLLYTDTDSLIYAFNVPNIYEIIKEDIHRFDTSDYDPENEFGIPLVNKKIPGLMKDENHGRIMTEFVGLRAKMYSYEVDGKLIKKSKGSTSSSMRDVTIDDYKRSLFNIVTIKKEQNLIRSKKHAVYTLKQNKVVLSPHDDKRVICANRIDTRPWGYCNFSNPT
ncbi:uncharacterized protein LOC116180481 [Photinus pyralis]|uniref:uncharacterized protein LOC116170623 n=1 Tax=Photinus pyralis TaxID=7054 RepID=UPI00126708A7|nr:uncharacterized protein LOC116170623 [Photinus pyralis]XP_031356382.1 uncharacterized protein LOC116180481 [Photinus pyralis]